MNHGQTEHIGRRACDRGSTACAHDQRPKSSSASRFTAGASGFLNLSQSGDTGQTDNSVPAASRRPSAPSPHLAGLEEKFSPAWRFRSFTIPRGLVRLPFGSLRCPGQRQSPVKRAAKVEDCLDAAFGYYFTIGRNLGGELAPTRK
jgi:hypothetical protein